MHYKFYICYDYEWIIHVCWSNYVQGKSHICSIIQLIPSPFLLAKWWEHKKWDLLHVWILVLFLFHSFFVIRTILIPICPPCNIFDKCFFEIYSVSPYSNKWFCSYFPSSTLLLEFHINLSPHWSRTIQIKSNHFIVATSYKENISKN